MVLLNLYLIEVAIDSTSLRFIPCRIQDERTAEKQQSKSPPQGLEDKGSVCFPQKMVQFEHAVKALAISHKLHFKEDFPKQSQGRSLPRALSAWGRNANFNMRLVASLSEITKMVK